jgi:antirestriction protein ArdC
MVSFFVVYNAEQVKDFPPLEHSSVPDTEISEIVDTFKSTSECEIVEAAQPKAYYSYVEDKIILPPRLFFKDDISFAKTMFHEMAHSTGHKTRLDRDMMHPFGTPEYAKEELRAEIGALFVETDLGLCLAAEHYQDHSNYLASWIKMLQDDPNEFFRACGEAEKISQRLIGNYRERYPMPELEMLPEKKRPEKERPERVNQRGRKR